MIFTRPGNLWKRLRILFFIPFVCLAGHGISQAKPSGPSLQAPPAVRLPPLFWYEYDPAEERRFLMAFLLYWRERDPEGAFDLLAPLYYRSQTREESLRVFLPLHFQYRFKDEETSLWGPYFSKRGARESTRFLFPLYYDSKSEKTRLTLLGPYYRQRTPRFQARVAFPLFWDWKPRDPEEKSYQLFLPFYLRVRDDVSRSYFSPLFWSFKDRAVSQGLVPPFFWRNRASDRTEVGFPLYWRFKRREEENDFKDVQVAVPWFRVSSRTRSFRSFFPIYWGRTQDLSEEEKSDVDFGLGPVQVSSGPRIRSWNVLLPLYFDSRRPDGRKKRFHLLASRFEFPDGTVYGHQGLGYYRRDPWGGFANGFFPFVHYRREPDSFRLRVLNFWMAQDFSGEHEQNVLFPLWRFKKDGDRSQILTPIFYLDRDPDRNRGYVFPYFWREDRPSEDNPNGPVRRRVLFPLAWHFRSEEARTTAFPPLFAFHEHENYKLALAAPFYFRRQKESDTLTIIPPVIRRRSPDRDWLGVFLIFWQNRKQERRALTLLPLFRRAEFPGGSSVFVPGFYYLKDAEGTQGVAGPYLWDRRGKTRYTFFVPLYWRFRRPTWEVASVFPFYRFRNEQIQEKGFFPLVARTEPVQTSTDAPKHFLADSHRVLPFYFYRKMDDGSDLWLPFLLGRYEKKYDAERRESVRGRLLLVTYWERSPSHAIRRLDPVFSYKRDPDRKGFTSPTAPFPLFRYEVEGLRDPESRTVKGAVFPYYWKETPRFRQDLFFPLYYRSLRREKTGEETSRKTWLLLYYASRDREAQKDRTLLVPFFWQARDAESRRTLMLPPAWFERGVDVERDFVFPFWWSARKDGERFFLFFPLWMQSSNESLSRRTFFALPGYWHSRDREGETVLAGLYFRKTDLRAQSRWRAFFPLYLSSRSPGRDWTAVFPLYWNLDSRPRSFRYFFPLYFRHSRESFDWSVAFPVFWKFETAESRTVVVPPYFVVTTPSTKTTGFAPLWTYLRNLEGTRSNLQVLGGLLGVEKSPEGRRIRILYLFEF